MANLLCCPTCKRHFRRAEARCPFCGVEASAELRSKRTPSPPPGLSRARLYAFQAAMATGVAAACGGGGSGDAGSPDAVADSPTDTASDGMQADSGGMDSQGMDSASNDSGGSDVVQDVKSDIFMPPPPYGCVFPEGCGDVKV
jgi:hypothetical protein